jgi:hypothetical protein
MGVVEVLDPVQPARAGGWKVDVSRGERNGRVSSEWFNRPDDERYLSLDDLWASVKGRSERSRSRVVQTADIRVEATRDSAERLHLVLPKAEAPVVPTHWAFGQLASIVGAPASYLRQLPVPLAGINLQYVPIPRKMGIDSTASWAAIPRLGQSGRLVHGVRLGLSGQVVSL